jgi:hypothetical protein
MSTFAEMIREMGSPQSEEELVIAADSVAGWLIASNLSEEVEVAMLDRARVALVHGWVSEGATYEVAKADGQMFISWVSHEIIKARMIRRRH